MPKKLNTTEKKLKFHCSACLTVYQLLESKVNSKTESTAPCLNNCSEKWQILLIEYCQGQIMLDLTKKEQTKEEKEPWKDLLEQKFKK